MIIPAVPAIGAARDTNDPYGSLLRVWMDGLLAHQVRMPNASRIDGGILCPACSIVHGRSGDAVYPLLSLAKLSGDDRYVEAARRVHVWSELNTSRDDGSWINDPVLSGWKGITVFRAIALAEALHRHGDLLDESTRASWRGRLRRAMKFLDGFITIDTGNINYPISASYAYALSARILGETSHEVRARSLAHQSLAYFPARGLLFGEGRPQTGTTPKGCRPVDLGYNVEESLPALALYARLTSDKDVEDAVVASLAAHLEFMLPDGAWDNSWGSRNYKWTYWGSRTSDGCHGALALLAHKDRRFGEAARRNLELMRRTTRNGLLAGGPDYLAAGYAPCIHHGMSHAKALATIVDAKVEHPASSSAIALPRDRPYGLRSWPEIDTHLVSVGDWRATVTGYDYEYPAAEGVGHASGGALTLLHHRLHGTIFAAGMLDYKVVEVGNQQTPMNSRHRSNIPGVYKNGNGARPIDASDSTARITTTRTAHGDVAIDVEHLVKGSPDQAGAGAGPLRMRYLFGARTVTICLDIPVSVSGEGACFLLPVVCSKDDVIAASPNCVRIGKSGSIIEIRSSTMLTVRSSELAFNLVPGFTFVEIEASCASSTLQIVISHLSGNTAVAPRTVSTETAG